MHQGFTQMLALCPRAVIIGCDLMALSAALLDDAARALDSADVVAQPTEDGGYALIGLRAARGELFQGIAWGSPSVWRQTRERINATGLRLAQLPLTWDLDTPADLLRAVRAGLLDARILPPGIEP
jgi:glycosyltransferase A (GT-A) superfamily protein (DUF2064 family)